MKHKKYHIFSLFLATTNSHDTVAKIARGFCALLLHWFLQNDWRKNSQLTFHWHVHTAIYWIILIYTHSSRIFASSYSHWIANLIEYLLKIDFYLVCMFVKTKTAQNNLNWQSVCVLLMFSMFLTRVCHQYFWVNCWKFVWSLHDKFANKCMIFIFKNEAMLTNVLLWHLHLSDINKNH